MVLARSHQPPLFVCAWSVLLLAQSPDRVGEATQRVLWSVIAIIVAIALVVIVGLVVRRLVLGSADQEATRGFTLSEMRRLHERGDLSDEEWAAARDALLAQARRGEEAQSERDVVTPTAVTPPATPEPSGPPDNLAAPNDVARPGERRSSGDEAHENESENGEDDDEDRRAPRQMGDKAEPDPRYGRDSGDGDVDESSAEDGDALDRPGDLDADDEKPDRRPPPTGPAGTG